MLFVMQSTIGYGFGIHHTLVLFHHLAKQILVFLILQNKYWPSLSVFFDKNIFNTSIYLWTTLTHLFGRYVFFESIELRQQVLQSQIRKIIPVNIKRLIMEKD